MKLFKPSFIKYAAVLLAAVIISGVCTLFSVRKTGMFVDEIYTYGLSNGYYRPFIMEADGSDEAMNRILTRQEFDDYLTVGEDDGFAFGSVYYNQSQDVHPPLYYWLFNIASSVVRPGFTKWTGLALDGVIYALALFVLYKLCMKLFKSWTVSLSAVIVYGISHIGVSTMLMIRMYVLLTLLTLVLAYLIVSIIEKPRSVYYPLVGLTILAGLMTQYYYVFYAFFLCAAFVIFSLIKKQYRSVIAFSVCAFAGVAAMFVVFPPFFGQLFGDSVVSGSTVIDNIRNVSGYKARIESFGKDFDFGFKAVKYEAEAALLLCIPFVLKILRSFKSRSVNCTVLLLIVPAVITYYVVVIISPVEELRYVYNIAPVFIIAAAWLLYLFEMHLDRRLAVLVLLAASAFSLWEIRTYPPDYLFPEHAEYTAAAESCSASPCVYFCDNDPGHLGPITQDILQLRLYEDVFVTRDNFSDELSDYIEDHGSNDSLVVYISINKSWGSGYSPEDIISLICDNTDYKSAERLYNFELSDTYLFKK